MTNATMCESLNPDCQPGRRCNRCKGRVLRDGERVYVPLLFRDSASPAAMAPAVKPNPYGSAEERREFCSDAAAANYAAGMARITAMPTADRATADAEAIRRAHADHHRHALHFTNRRAAE